MSMSLTDLTETEVIYLMALLKMHVITLNERKAKEYSKLAKMKPGKEHRAQEFELILLGADHLIGKSIFDKVSLKLFDMMREKGSEFHSLPEHRELLERAVVKNNALLRLAIETVDEDDKMEGGEIISH